MSKIISKIDHIKVDDTKFTKEQLKYLDNERMDQTRVRIVFPKGKDDMEEKYYMFFAVFLKQRFKLPVKYLEPEIDSCSYISQKSTIIGNTKHISDASVTIEPLNQNVFKQISYTPINQAFDIGTVVSVHEQIPYTNDDGSTPSRRLLTSASLKCAPYAKATYDMLGHTYKAEYKGLCNRCIPYTSIDIGSEIIGKFTVKLSTLRQSMALYKFCRPDVNILEIITPDYLNVNCEYIINATMDVVNNDETIDKDDKKEFMNIAKEILTSLHT